MYFDFQGHYDDVRIDLMSKWGMKSYLRLILYLNMEKNWQSLFTSMDFLWACFCPYMLCNTKIARTDGYLERTRVLRDFLWNAYNGLKRMPKKFRTILSNLKFYARIYARTYAYAHFWTHLLTWNWPDKYWPWSWQIWMRNGFLLWRYDRKLIFTKWRLDDVTMILGL